MISDQQRICKQVRKHAKKWNNDWGDRYGSYYLYLKNNSYSGISLINELIAISSYFGVVWKPKRFNNLINNFSNLVAKAKR
jgi:hypothetical protein